MNELRAAAERLLDDWDGLPHGLWHALKADVADLRTALASDTGEAGVERLARALHEQRAATSFAGCGWKFGSVVDGEPMCPCPADARDLIARMSERQ